MKKCELCGSKGYREVIEHSGYCYMDTKVVKMQCHRCRGTGWLRDFPTGYFSIGTQSGTNDIDYSVTQTQGTIGYPVKNAYIRKIGHVVSD